MLAAFQTLSVALKQPPRIFFAASPVQPLFRGVEVEPLDQYFFRIVVFVVILHAQFALDCGVPVVFDGVVGASGQPLGN